MVAYKEYSYMLNSVVVSGGIHAYTACSVIFSGELMGSFFLDFIVLCLQSYIESLLNGFTVHLMHYLPG